MRIGKFEIEVLNLGTILMDGGGVFGIVPKPLWQRLIPSDEHNRVRLGINCLLVRSDEVCLLAETGLGNKLDSRLQEIYGVDGEDRLLQALAGRGVAPEEVTHVVVSHLHFLPAGGCTTRRSEDVIPTFPNAQYIAQQAEWEEATNRTERTRGSYFEDDYKQLLEAGRLRLLPGSTEILPGIEAVLTGGHTAGHQCVTVSSGNEKIVFLGHLIPTAWHLVPHYIMAHDLYPAETLVKKKHILNKAAAERWILVFLNDPTHPAGYAKRTEAGYALEPVDL